MGFCGHCGAARSNAPSAPPQEAERDVTDALRSFVAEQVADRLVEAGGKLPEERRLITALFADVSGFTSLADRLDPEELLEVIDPVISALSSIVGRYEGYVEKFAGDALLALFGAPVAHEDDAERALHVALEMHSELARLCTVLPHEAELTLHVGVNSGHGIARILGSEARMDYAVLGDSVILAQRLESAAPKGETYASELTVKLTEDRFDFEPVGELTLKGKSEPVPAWRLLGERRSQARTARSVGARRLVGRAEELAAVTDVLDTLAGGRGGIVSVTGEPGVGKSRLTEEAWALATERGFRCLETRCLSYGAGLAYWPYSELLRNFAELRTEDAPAEAASRLRAALEELGASDAGPFFERLLGLEGTDSSGEIAGLEPQAFRRALHDAFAAWVRAVAREQQAVVIFEDIHWADASSLELTRELAAVAEREPLLLYLVGRPEAESVLAELPATQHAIRVKGLDEHDVETLIESWLEGPPPQDLASFVGERTGGNPFFVEEILRSLHETGAVAWEDGSWTMRPGWDARALPTTVEEVLAARIDLLSRAAAGVLQTASVIGRRVRIPLLSAVAESTELPEALDQLVASGFLNPGEENGEEAMVFHHALVQDVAYSRLLRRRRQELHRRVAEVAEGLYGAGEDTIDLLARHLYLGGAGAKAVEYLVRAGERARRLFANEEAILHLTRGVEIVRGEPELSGRLPELQLSLGELHELVGNYDQALGLYDEVLAATSDVRAWRGLAATYRKLGKYLDALDVVEQAFKSEELKGHDLLPLWLEQGWSLATSGHYDEAVDVLQAGLEAAASRREPIVAHVRVVLARAQGDGGEFDAALDNALLAKEIFEECADVTGLASTLRVIGGTYLVTGRYDEAGETLRRGLELAQRVGSAEEIAACLINLGLVELRRGRLDEAIAFDRQALDVCERVGLEPGRATAYVNLAEKLAHREDYEEALAACEKAVEIAQAIGRPYAIADVVQVRALIALGTGAFAEAARKAEEAAARFLELGASPSAAESLQFAAEAWKKAGEAERARDTTERALSL
jgi:class 3 adenylate cyclase/tetratricopeptide (TPR) repeat protein